MRRLQHLGQGQRILVFTMLMVGGLLLIAGITVLLILLSINSSPRITATALLPNVTVSQFAALPDNDAYPAAVEVAADGTVVFTGSYMTGAVWAITTAGELRELPGTRDQLGSVVGIAAAADGSLYILDRVYSDPRSAGGVIWRLDADGTLSIHANIDDESGFISPHAIAIDGTGSIYATDRGRREVWRWNADGTNGILWWSPDEAEVLPTGIAFDPANNAMLVTDTEENILYRISIDTGTAEVIYRYTGEGNKPALDGVDVASDGTIYVTALEQNGLAMITEGTLSYLVGTFRGASDLAVAPDGKIYVTNFDSAALVVPGMQPQLPFAIDVVTVGANLP